MVHKVLFWSGLGKYLTTPPGHNLAASLELPTDDDDMA